MRRIRRGDRPRQQKARDWNDLVDVRDRIQNSGTEPPEFAGRRLRVHNTTAATLPPRSVLMIDGPLITPAASRAESHWTVFPGFAGIVPVDRTEPTAIVITTQALRPGQVGEALLDGTFWVQVRIDDEAHQYAAPITGQTKRLRSDRVGPARILWRERTPWPVPANYNHLPTVIDRVDNTQPPPAEEDGDRYLLDSTGSSHANWDGAPPGSLVQFIAGTWLEITPTTNDVVHSVNEDLDYRFDGTDWISGPTGSWPSWPGVWCLIHLSSLQEQLAPSQARFGYVDQSVTAAEVADRDADSDALTYDTEDPDTQVDDDLTPGRGSVHLWDFQISRRSDQRFAITGFNEPVPGEPQYDQPIVSDVSGRLAALTAGSRVYIEQSTRSTGYYYLTADASADAGQTTLFLAEDLAPLPEPNPDAEVLGSVVPEVWAPVWKRDTDGQIVLAEQSVSRIDESGDAIPGATDELPVRADPLDVWNLWEATSYTTATPVRVVREHDRWSLDHGGCGISDLDMTPDVDL